jgi:hypothetical protein
MEVGGLRVEGSMMCITVLKPNSRTYSFIEVPGQNREKVLIPEVSQWISSTIGKRVWFSISFSSFLLYGNFKRLREFEEIEISRQSYCI